jgi:hypothetical protein
MDNHTQKGLVDSQGRIDMNDPNVKARVEYLGTHAEKSIMQDFIAKHPELLNVDAQSDIRNKEIVVDVVLKGSGLPLTPENLELAYQVALNSGEITLGMYSPQELEAFPRMTTKQMAEYLERRYQAPKPQNAAELLPQFGERTWRSDASTMGDEESAALREKLLRTRR